jgi:hypothetical protein
MQAEIGDVIRCNGRTAIISEIYYSDYSENEGWMIEGRDQNKEYFMWKQYFDGGTLERRTK